jgi:predicted SprT family Zn-dependent metalloprotease
MQHRFDQVLARCKEIIDLANRMFNLNMTPVISFNLRGATAGTAQWRTLNGKIVETKIRFNRDMIMGDGFNHIFNDTIPHEIAHLVCGYLPNLGNGHDRGWQNVCTRLGGKAQRCHTEAVSYAHGSFVYVATCGTRVTVSKIIHNKIQRGQGRSLRTTGGKVNMYCAWAKAGQEPVQRMQKAA